MTTTTGQAILILCTFGLVALGQNNPREGERRNWGATGRGQWIGRRLNHPEFIEKVGIKGEQAEKLKGSLEQIEKESQRLDEQIGQAAVQQAEVAKKVLAEPGADPEEMIKLVEKIGQMRTEQAKLATRRLVALRDHLTPEQRERAARVLADDQQRWREEREGGGREGGRERNAAPNRAAPAEAAKRPAAQVPRPAAPQGW